MKNFAEIKETFASVMREQTSIEDVELLSSLFLRVFNETFAGEMVYVPNVKKDVIRDKIRAKFNGKNQRDLAHEFGYTTSMIYKILKCEKPKQKDAFL